MIDDSSLDEVSDDVSEDVVLDEEDEEELELSELVEGARLFLITLLPRFAACTAQSLRDLGLINYIVARLDSK